jgi:hypothetical protein
MPEYRLAYQRGCFHKTYYRGNLVLAALAMAIFWGPAYILSGKQGLVAEPGGTFSGKPTVQCVNWPIDE